MIFTRDPYVVALWLSLLLSTAWLYRNLSSPLRNIPGPLFARLTRLWYLLQCHGGELEKVNIRLHSKYGKVVRLAPNEYSLDDPDAVKTIYGRGSNFRKSDYYSAFEFGGLGTVFTTRNIDQHVQERKSYHPAYTMSSMTAYEGYVDECLSLFMTRLREMAQAGSWVDLAEWNHFFAFDVISLVTYSKRFGFLDSGKDENQLIRSLHTGFSYTSKIGIYNELHPAYEAIAGVLVKLGLVNTVARQYLLGFVRQRLGERQPELAKLGRKDASETVPTLIDDDQQGPKDFVTKFVESNQHKPDRFGPTDVLRGTMANIFAGSDTTSTTMSATLYYLLKNPEKLAKLRQEIADHVRAGSLSDPATFKETQDMQYLQAVIKEAMRLYPAVGVPLKRVVPDGGSHISGHFFPSGTIVGINAWVAHHNAEVFGPDAATFRPERWLKSETDEGTLSKMQHYYMPFGLGSRTCLGQHVAMLELVKCVPQMIRNFDFEMDGELRRRERLVSRNAFLVMPKNFFVRVSDREGSN